MRISPSTKQPDISKNRLSDASVLQWCRHIDQPKVRKCLAIANSQFVRAFAVSLLVIPFAGCSIHPIPEDVARAPTDKIVASVRCEMRLGFFEQVGELLKKEDIGDFDYRDLFHKPTRHQILNNKTLGSNEKLAEILDDYGNSAIAYDFDFEITEENDLASAFGFQLPFTAPSVFDLSLAGSVEKTRVGKRTFRSQQTFGELVNDDWCKRYFGPRSEDLPLAENFVYPISGSIGMREVVRTFMRLSEQGGGKDNFVDLLTFTTAVGGSAEASVKLNAVPHSFRLVSANANLSGGRVDIHRVKVSLAFPLPKATRERLKKKREEQQEREKKILEPDGRSAVWRARYNICVADARDREDRFKVLRNSPPEVYCIKYANAFVPFSKRFPEYAEEEEDYVTITNLPVDDPTPSSVPEAYFDSPPGENVDQIRKPRPSARGTVRTKRKSKPKLPSWW